MTNCLVIYKICRPRFRGRARVKPRKQFLKSENSPDRTNRKLGAQNAICVTCPDTNNDPECAHHCLARENKVGKWGFKVFSKLTFYFGYLDSGVP